MGLHFAPPVITRQTCLPCLGFPLIASGPILLLDHDMGRTDRRVAYCAAAMAVGLFGCAGSDQAGNATSGTYQTSQGPQAPPATQAGEGQSIDPLVAEEQRTYAPYKPVLRADTVRPAEPARAPPE